MSKDRQEDTAVDKARLTAPVLPATAPPAFRWPWGVIALLVLALGWVGAYLLWNGIVFLFQL